MSDRGPDEFVRCARGHINAATATNCRLCGLPLPGRGRRPPDLPGPREVGRPWWQRLLAFLRRSWPLVLAVAVVVVSVVSIGVAGRHGTPRGPAGTPSPTGSRAAPHGPASTASVSTPTPAPSPFHTIGPGDSGPEVLLLQKQLAALGYPVVPDGQFGSRTSSVVIDFNVHHGMSSNAFVGPQTWRTLREAAQRATSSATPSS